MGVNNQPLPADGPALPLTTVELPLREQGRRIGQTLRDLLEGRTVPLRQDVLPTRIIERASTRRGA